MFKKIFMFFSIILLGACTFVNPEQDEGSATDGQQTTQLQMDENRPDEIPEEDKLIRYNLYENPYEYYEQRETDESLSNTTNPARTEKARQQNELNRQIYYELRSMREISEVGVSVQDQQIYVSVNLANRVNKEEAIEKIKKVVENITERTDITILVDQEFHNKIENRKKD